MSGTTYLVQLMICGVLIPCEILWFPFQAGADLEYQLLEAAKAGDLELVKKIVQEHPHIVNCRDLDGRHSTPLHFAAGYNRVGVVEFLLQHGK